MWLMWRALFSFMMLPGIVAFLVPWLIAGRRIPGGDEPFGLVLLAAGSVGLIWCVAEFYRLGRGTLAPWDPPKHLVVTGTYAWSRNPMYIAVTTVLWGWALLFTSWRLGAYAVAVMLAFHARVVYYEEPWLAGRHGERWTRYRERVPRWVGRVRRGEPDPHDSTSRPIPDAGQ